MFKYNYEVSLNSNNSAAHILKLIKPNTRVLEFGCATGYMSRALVENKKCTVVGVEIDEDAAKLAESYCEKVIVGDIEQLKIEEIFLGYKFDYILFADVLEHLKRPDLVLGKCANFLKEDGFILASVPNIAHVSIILNLVKGIFRYQNIGLLDNTHLKFFTKETLIELFEKCGYIAHIDSKVKIKPQNTEFSTSFSEFPSAIIENIYALNQEADTYQFIVKASKLTEVNRINELYKKNEDLRNELLKKQKEINKLSESIELQQEYSSKLEAIIKVKDEEFQKLEYYVNNLKKEYENFDINAGSEQERESLKFEEVKCKMLQIEEEIEEKSNEILELKAENEQLIQINNDLVTDSKNYNEVRISMNHELSNLKLELNKLQTDVDIAKKVRSSKLLSKLIEWKN